MALDLQSARQAALETDFGLAGLASDPPPFKLGPKMLANSTQDSGEILTVDISHNSADDGADRGRLSGTAWRPCPQAAMGRRRNTLIWRGAQLVR